MTGAYLHPSPVAFAHRGGAACWPENTLCAFEGALRLGYRYVETDVHLTRDGVVVVFHDETLERTTDGVGRLRDLDYAELATLDAGFRFTPDGGRTFPHRGQGLVVPRLEDALALDPGLCLNLEMKQADPPMERALLEAIDRARARDRVLVASAQERLVARFRRLPGARGIPTSAGAGGIVRFWGGVRSGLGRLDRYPFDALQVPVTHGPLRVVDARFVDEAHRRGIRVHVWTIDEPNEMRRLLDLGVDGVMTDRPDLLKEVLRERGLWAT